MEKTLTEALDEKQRRAEQGPWYPASGGTETPFPTRTGRRLQYMFQPSTGQHAYYDCDGDVFLTTEEACKALGA